MSDQRRAPRSVAAPDREPYERSVRDNTVFQNLRERHEIARSTFLDSAAGIGDRITTAIDAGVDGAMKYVSDPRAKHVMNRAKRRAGPVGTAISAYDANRQYEQDVASGMPKDEAGVKAVGGFVGGQIGSAVGALGGAAVGGATGLRIYRHPIMGGTGAVVGAVGGAIKGGDQGEKIGQRVVEPYRRAKDWTKGVTRPLYDPIYLYDMLTRRY